MHSPSRPGRSQFWLSTIPALLILLFTVAQGTSEKIQSRMLGMGEAAWPGYAELRHDPQTPSCDPASFTKRAPAAADDLDALFDEVDDEAAGDDEAGGDAEIDLDAIFAEDEPADDLDAIFDEAGEEADGGPSAEEQQAIALSRAKEACEAEHLHYTDLISRVTPGLKVWRSIEGAVAALNDMGRKSSKFSLVLLVLICASTTTYLRAHIALRPVKSQLDNKVSEGVQLLVNLVLISSCWAHYQTYVTSGVHSDFGTLPLFWAAGFAVMSLFNVRHLVQVDPELEEGGSLGHALLTQPLYAMMATTAMVWFYGFEGYPSGLAIYLDKLVEHASLYVQVGLYVWAGMLLKQTAIDTRAFDLLRPWKLPPELLAAVVVVVAAIPTAYSGASGIFVIAAGGIIYHELRKAGARNQLALAATAMSGSLGVVLSPCLLVVIVASLNKQVTTVELFGAGRMVFLLSAAMFVFAVIVTRQNPLTMAPAAEAMPGVKRASRALVPYALMMAGVLGVYAIGLESWLNEHTAPTILPVVLLAFLFYERSRAPEDDEPEDAATGFGGRIAAATTETTAHIGALLILMALSVCLGGIMERAEVMTLVPSEFSSVWVTMTFLTTLLVIIGMIMDPYGAVILVSATIAHVAYDNGIDPLHFWMVVLVAFELGYLTPPVALNHLLTRQVVGDAADLDDVPAGSGFYRRYERIMLPVTVMGTTLIIVAFGPLLF